MSLMHLRRFFQIPMYSFNTPAKKFTFDGLSTPTTTGHSNYSICCSGLLVIVSIPNYRNLNSAAAGQRLDKEDDFSTGDLPRPVVFSLTWTKTKNFKSIRPHISYPLPSIIYSVCTNPQYGLIRRLRAIPDRNP